MNGSPSEESLRTLFARLTSDLTALVADEIALAKMEISQKVTKGGSYSALIGIGAAIGYAGFLALTAACVYALISAGLAPWLSALIIAVVFMGVGSVLALIGFMALRSMKLMPRRTAETLKNDRRWAAERFG